MPLNPDQPPEDFRSVLASVDKQGHRRFVAADIAGGVWRKRRVVVSVFLIAFYMVLPFIQVGGYPLLFIDIPNRAYVFLGHVFQPQDVRYLVLFFLLFLIGTLLMVALFGRVFCGWLCPHNVFLEMVFRPIEQLLEGRGHRRAAAHRKGGAANLAGRKFIKWVLYALVAGALANTATAVFVGREAFIGGILIDPINHPTAAFFFTAFFGAIVFNFGWFREQTCMVVCPYGKMQAAMLDDHTLGVSYDKNRGEPRGKKDKAEGDCVDCGRCVQVCPTGIDIRNGSQFECIHCTACIDACDTVMDKIGRERGLIRYAAECEIQGRGKRKVIRPRTIFYAVVYVALVAVTVLSLVSRQDVLVRRMRDTAAASYGESEAGVKIIRKVVNLLMVSRVDEPRELDLSLIDVPGGNIRTQTAHFELGPQGERELTLFLEIPADHPSKTVDLQVDWGTGSEQLEVMIRR
ncbi:MAG: cytochrome c oxidase accessory protein CcoG [Planctomycetota bacterium]|jgi:cytochrome c oxidase accessory protein FixG|nr:cytochrome c oxidase accessory protein CcoG [Planctomycetota bacterium]